MFELLAIIAGVTAGFVGARLLRRPASTAAAASMARSVGGAVGTRRDLDLARLQRSVFSEMMRHVTSGGGAVIVPAAYRVRLHPEDHATVSQAPGFFSQGLEQAMASAGHERGWQVPARLRIELSVDPTRRRGVPTVDAEPPPSTLSPGSGPGTRSSRSSPAARASSSPAPSAAPARLIRQGNPTTTHPLRDPTTIGRGTDRTVRVEDSRASRRHATLRRDGGSWTLTDEGSSNGTRLGGRTIAAAQPIALRDGDEIIVGGVTFVFRAGVESMPPVLRAPGQQPFAQRVLDERERRNISQELFPIADSDPDGGRR